MLKKAAYAGLGVILCAAAVATGTYGLNQKNKDIYIQAIELQEEMDKIGFPRFALADYPVRFYDGKSDYVVHLRQEGTGAQSAVGLHIEKEDPVFPTYVGTACEVDDHYEVVEPTVEKFSGLSGMLNAAGNLQSESLDFASNEYGAKEHAATIWHEAFHAYQSTCYPDGVEKLRDKMQLGEADSMEALVVSKVDENPQVKALLEQELALLKEAVLAKDIDAVKEKILEYKELEEQRREMLPGQVCAVEDYFETMEGTARYVESGAYRLQYGEERWMELYVQQLDGYSAGSAKYYQLGMAKAMLLDRLCPDWKSSYDFSYSILECLYRSI